MESKPTPPDQLSDVWKVPTPLLSFSFLQAGMSKPSLNQP
jgi:hypothetical protein